MIVLSTSKMNHGTFQAKFMPLSLLPEISKIYVLRKEIGPEIDKLEYILLPKICKYSFFNLLLTPLILSYYAIKLRVDFILCYHFVPHLFFGLFASMISRKPFIFGQTGNDIQKFVNKKIFQKKILFMLNKAVSINVPGEQSLSFWKSYKIPENKINILHSTINTDFYCPDKTNKEFDFIYIGRLVDYKGVDTIIEAFSEIVKKYSNAKLAIIGDGKELNLLKKLTDDLNLNDNVIFFGFRYNVKKYLNMSKIFVMCSETEGLPVSMLEAMSCEKIIISTSVGNIQSVLYDNKTGFITSGKPNELKEKLFYAYENYNELHSMREQARNVVIEKYSYISAKKKWNKIINLLNKN